MAKAAVKAAIWVRISDPRSGTIKNQLPALQKWAEQRGLEVVHTFETEESAFQGVQQYLDPMMEAARMGEFQVLLIWALDRLSRRGIRAILDITAKLDGYGVTVWSHEEPWLETSDASARELMLSMTGWMARQESQRLSERIKAGLQRAKAQGKKLGRRPGSKDKKKRRRAGYYARYDKRGGR